MTILAAIALPRLHAPPRWTGARRQGLVSTSLLVALILLCVIALLSASLFGVMQQRVRASRIGGRYSPELQQYYNEQNELLNETPHWVVKPLEDTRTLVIPIEMAMQSMVERYGKKQEQLKLSDPASSSSSPSQDGGR
jgi:hypothetical protein